MDHLQRSFRALAGVQVFGLSWLRVWFCYLISPLLSRLLPGREWDVGLCRFRTGEGDIYTFANLFADYPAAQVRTGLRGIEQIIDAGANVGAFSLLVSTLAEQAGMQPRIIALEPMKENVQLLQRQPFASKLEILHAALGPADGGVSMQRGINSVTHQADFNADATGEKVQMISLATLCDRPSLLKMDIEGGEHEVLAAGLPKNVRSLLLEWHPRSGDRTETTPASIIPHGVWQLVSRDLHGSTMWFWQADF